MRNISENPTVGDRELLLTFIFYDVFIYDDLGMIKGINSSKTDKEVINAKALLQYPVVTNQIPNDIIRRAKNYISEYFRSPG